MKSDRSLLLALLLTLLIQLTSSLLWNVYFGGGGNISEVENAGEGVSSWKVDIIGDVFSVGVLQHRQDDDYSLMTRVESLLHPYQMFWGVYTTSEARRLCRSW